MTVETKSNMNKTKWRIKVIHLIITVAFALSFTLVTTVPALAAPSVNSVTETAFDTDTTDHYVNMPSTVDAGDLLIVLFTTDGTATVITPVGWTALASNAGNGAVRLSVYYKIAGGAEGGTTVNFMTSAAEEAAAHVYRITDWNGTTPPEISAAVTGTNTRPNPAFLDPAGWDISDTLWLAVAGQDRGDQDGPTAYPAYYTDGISTLSSEAITSCQTHSACRVLTAASENPWPFTIPASEQWVAYTIAVRPIQYNLTTCSTAGGTVTTPGEGLFTYDEGTVVELIAEAKEGCRFVEWTGDVEDIIDIYGAETIIIMNGYNNITANFVAIHDLTTSSTAAGSVTEPGEDTFAYDEGTVVDLIAEAEEGSWFIEWSGDVGTIADVYATTTTIIMKGDYSITANFVSTYDLTVSSTAGGSVTTPDEGVFTYGELSVIGLTAEAEEDYRFVEWTGDVGTIDDVYAPATTITMHGDYSITANFEEISSFQYDLTTFSTEGGSVTEPGEGVFTYNGGAAVDLMATPDEGYQFVDWTGDVDTIADIEDAVTTITVNGDYSITANFIAAPSGGCFIATAAYGTSTAEQIDVLRDFRDVVLLESILGSQFVAMYYQLSPPVADFIAGNELLRTLVREFLIDPIVSVVEATGYIWQPWDDLE